MLLNIQYILDFITNLVSGNILQDKGLDIDSQYCRLYRNSETVLIYTRVNMHYLIRDNTKDTVNETKVLASFSAALVKGGTIQEQYQILIYTSNQAIQYLESAIKGVKLLNNARVPPRKEYEIYALSKVYRIILRSLNKVDFSDKPFYRIIYDLIQIKPVLNNYYQILSITYSELDFQLIYIYQRKREATAMLKKLVYIISIRFSAKIALIRLNSKKSLGLKF